MSSDLVWQLIRKNNSFLRKGRTGKRTIFSVESGNLLNKHSKKYSGLANEKTIDIQPGEGETVIVTNSRPKNKNKPSQSKASYTSKKNTSRAALSVAKEALRSRPDLQKAVKSRISEIGFAQRKRNRLAASSN